MCACQDTRVVRAEITRVGSFLPSHLSDGRDWAAITRHVAAGVFTWSHFAVTPTRIPKEPPKLVSIMQILIKLQYPKLLRNNAGTPEGRNLGITRRLFRTQSCQSLDGFATDSLTPEGTGCTLVGSCTLTSTLLWSININYKCFDWTVLYFCCSPLLFSF